MSSSVPYREKSRLIDRCAQFPKPQLSDSGIETLVRASSIIGRAFVHSLHIDSGNKWYNDLHIASATQKTPSPATRPSILADIEGAVCSRVLKATVQVLPIWLRLHAEPLARFWVSQDRANCLGIFIVECCGHLRNGFGMANQAVIIGAFVGISRPQLSIRT